MPAFNPVTTPVDELMLTAVPLALHVPPPGVEFIVVVKPTHTANEGLAVIAVGSPFTVTIVVLIQPVLRV